MEENLPNNTPNNQIQENKTEQELEEQAKEVIPPDIYLELQKIEISKINTQKLIEQARWKSQKEIIDIICSTGKEIIEQIRVSEKDKIAKLFWHSTIKEIGKFFIVLTIILSISYLSYNKIVPAEVLVPMLTMIVGAYVTSKITKE